MKTHDPFHYAWWLASRSAGIVAYLLLSLSILLGVIMALRVAPPKTRPALRRGHQRIALIAFAAIGVHGLLLLGDSWLKPSIYQLLVPFTSHYRPLWTGLGICAGYIAVGLSLTYYLRRRIGPRRWRYAHRFIPIAWLLATLHVLGAGTDAGSLWLQAILAGTVSIVVVLLIVRLFPAASHAQQNLPIKKVLAPSSICFILLVKEG